MQLMKTLPRRHAPTPVSRLNAKSLAVSGASAAGALLAASIASAVATAARSRSEAR
jgi:hypothetical protein